MDRHNYIKVDLGFSDEACLVVESLKEDYNIKLDLLRFEEDGNYYAYLCDEKVDIPDFYELVFEGKHWIRIYDNEGLTFTFDGDDIKIYRAYNRGCMIVISNKNNRT